MEPIPRQSILEQLQPHRVHCVEEEHYADDPRVQAVISIEQSSQTVVPPRSIEYMTGFRNVHLDIHGQYTLPADWTAYSRSVARGASRKGASAEATAGVRSARGTLRRLEGQTGSRLPYER